MIDGYVLYMYMYLKWDGAVGGSGVLLPGNGGVGHLVATSVLGKINIGIMWDLFWGYFCRRAEAVKLGVQTYYISYICTAFPFEHEI